MYTALILSVLLFLSWLLLHRRQLELKPYTATEWLERMRALKLGVK